MNAYLFATAYLPPVQQFARLIRADRALVEHCENYQKQTYRNRAIILGANGPMALTIPIVHTGRNHQPVGQVLISRHDNWAHTHFQALASAYESSPFFRFYASDLRALYANPPERLVDFNAALMRKLMEWFFIDTSLEPTREYHASAPAGYEDCRALISPKTPSTADKRFSPVPYYQVFSRQRGFTPNLSAVDLLFNLGPEARIVLLKSFRP